MRGCRGLTERECASHHQGNPAAPALPHTDVLLQNTWTGTVAQFLTVPPQVGVSAASAGAFTKNRRVTYSNSRLFIAANFFWNKGLTAPFSGKTQYEVNC